MMRRLRFLILLILPFFIAINGWSADLPTFTGRIVDHSNTLSANQITTLNHLLLQLEDKTGGQMAVYLEDHIPENTTLEERAYAIATHWKIGHKGHDNGALLYFAMKDRRNRLEIGYGWEAWINDARAGDLLRAIAPLLRQGQTAHAIEYIIRNVAKYVDEKIPAPKRSTRPQRSPTTDAIQAILLLLLIGLALWSMNPRQRERFIFLVYVHQLLTLLLHILMNSRGGGRGGSGGGFSGGGGSFGGGGASGRW